MTDSNLLESKIKAVGLTISAVAEKLGIAPRTLRYKIAKMRELGMIIPG